jgi:flagellar protein FliT
MTQNDVILKAHSLTEAIQAAAAGNEWNRAVELTGALGPLLRRLAPEQSSEALTVIRKIQASMDSISQSAREAQNTLTTQYRQSMNRASAAGRYQQAAQF